MTKPTIIITGANGFIGESLLNYLAGKGWKIKAFVHSVPQNKRKDVEYVRYSLEEQPSEINFRSVNYLVHCAYVKYEKNKNADAINLNGTAALVELCRKNNIKPVFLSSFSAHKKAESHYGISKLNCENLFDVSTEVILKPGFVIGKKGVGADLIRSIKNSSFFPLIGGGNQPIQTIYINDLCVIIETVIEKNKKGLFHVAETNAISMKQFYQEIAKQLNKKTTFIYFPLPLLYIICRIAERLGIPVPVSSESVLGLKHLVTFETKADLENLEVCLKNYSESLQLILKEQ